MEINGLLFESFHGLGEPISKYIRKMYAINLQYKKGADWHINAKRKLLGPGTWN